MEAPEGSAVPPSHLLESVNAGFERLVNRYASAWSDAAHSIQPPLVPADTYFAPAGPSDATTCPLCSQPFPTNDLLRAHMAKSHPNLHASTHALTLAQTAFPNPLKALRKPSDDAAAAAKGPKDASSPEAWMPIPPEVLHAFSPLEAVSPGSSADGKAPVTNPSLYCSLCSVQCGSDEQLDNHWGGAKHRRKVEAHLAFVEAKKTFEEEGIKEVTPISWRCSYCDAELSGKAAVLQHLITGKHKKNKQPPLQEMQPLKKRSVVSSLLNNSPITKTNVASKKASIVSIATRTPDRVSPTVTAPAAKQTSSSSTWDTLSEKRGVPLTILRAAQEISNKRASIVQRTTPTPPKKDNDGKDECPSPAKSSESFGFSMSEASKCAVFMPKVQQAVSPMNIKSSRKQPRQNDMVLSPTKYASPTFDPTAILAKPKQRNAIMRKREDKEPKQTAPSADDKMQVSPIPNMRAFVSCVLCDEYFDSIDALSAHLTSPEHIQKQTVQGRERAEKQKEFFSKVLGTGSAKQRPSTLNAAAGEKTGPGATRSLYCPICNVSCNSVDNLESHLRGKLHAKRVRHAEAKKTM